MLGFTTISGAPLSQASTSLKALAYLAPAEIGTTVAPLLYDAKAVITNPSTISSFTANVLLFDAKALRSISGITLATAINDVLYDAKANITPSAVTSSFTAGTLDYSALAYITMSPTVATIQALDVEYDAKASITPSAVTSSVATNNVDYNAKAYYYTTTLLATFEQTLDEPTAVTFNYQQYADSYERNRTLYIVSDVKGHTVHIPERGSTTIYLGAQDTNRTVKIAA
jgi:hypothetical protein